MQFSFVPGFSQSKSSFSNTSPGKLFLLKYASLKRYLWIPRPSSASFQITGGRRNSVFCPFSPRDHFSEFHEAIHKDAQTTVQRLWRFFARVIRSALHSCSTASNPARYLSGVLMHLQNKRSPREWAVRNSFRSHFESRNVLAWRQRQNFFHFEIYETRKEKRESRGRARWLAN